MPGADPGDPREQPRHNLAAFNTATGQPLPWAPTVESTPFTSTTHRNDCDDLGDNRWGCDAVWEIKPSPDRTHLYIGGDFTITWTQTWDRDNAQLTYQLIRDDTTVVHTLDESSAFWGLKIRTYTDTGLTPGSRHTYAVRAIDPYDNRHRSARSEPVQAG